MRNITDESQDILATWQLNPDQRAFIEYFLQEEEVSEATSETSLEVLES